MVCVFLDDKDFENVDEQLSYGIIIRNNKTINDKPQTQLKPIEITELSDDNGKDNDKVVYKEYDPKIKNLFFWIILLVSFFVIILSVIILISVISIGFGWL